jgi:hypothetical protein
MTMRTWDENGKPKWVEPMTEEEHLELDEYGFEPTLKVPFCSLLPGSDLTNLVAFPLLRRLLAKKTRLQMDDLVTLQE